MGAVMAQAGAWLSGAAGVPLAAAGWALSPAPARGWRGFPQRGRISVSQLRGGVPRLGRRKAGATLHPHANP